MSSFTPSPSQSASRSQPSASASSATPSPSSSESRASCVPSPSVSMCMSTPFSATEATDPQEATVAVPLSAWLMVEDRLAPSSSVSTHTSNHCGMSQFCLLNFR